MDIRASNAPTTFNDVQGLELDPEEQDPNDFAFDDENDALLNFTEIPVMSNDGAYEAAHS